MTTLPPVHFRRLEHGAGLPLPRYVTAGAAGFDFAAANLETVTVEPRGRAVIGTGFAVAVPKGYELQIRPRSGLAYKHGITITNAPGTIDSDYRGEIMIMLVNHSDEPFTVERNERIAQGIIAEAPQFEIIEVDSLNDTDRGTNGLGSTGKL